MIEDFNINFLHHRFAAWAASRAASTSPLCRFKVEQGVAILEKCGFDSSFDIDDLSEVTDMKMTHRDWRNSIIKKAKKFELKFTHGVAAKLINVYLKSRIVCGGYENDNRVVALHPPIDSVLLTSLAKNNVFCKKSEWLKFRNMRWSKYDSDTYEAVINLITESLDGKPLWKIEYYWKGYR